MSNLTRRFFAMPSIDRDEFLTPFDRLFDRMVKDALPGFSNELGSDFFEKGAYPRVNVINYPDKVKIQAEIPGLRKEDINVRVDNNNCLTISGNKKDDLIEKDATYVVRELKKSSFKRSFLLDEKFDKNTVKATFENGILNVVIHKKETEIPRTIDVNIE